MAGYQTIEALRLILHKGPPPTPVVRRELVSEKPAEPVPDVAALEAPYKRRNKNCPTAAQVAKMIELRKQGVATNTIGLRVGFAHSTVKRHVQGVAVPDHLKIKGRPRAEYDVAEAERMWAAGATYAAIGKALGVHPSAIYVRLNGKCPVYKRGKPRDYSGRAPRRLRLDEIVQRVTGFALADLQEGRSTQVELGRARVLLQWLLRFKQPEMPYSHIARICGRKDHTTSINAYNRVQSVIADLGISTRGTTADVVRRIWEAEWPKASA